MILDMMPGYSHMLHAIGGRPIAVRRVDVPELPA
jgi:hypothetical protein